MSDKINIASFNETINKTFNIGKYKKISIEFGENFEKIPKFKISDVFIRDGSLKRDLILTPNQLNLVISMLEKAWIDVSLDSPVSTGQLFSNSLTPIKNSKRNYELITEYYFLSSKKYVDVRLWFCSELQRIPTRRGFKIGLHEIESAISNLKDIQIYFKIWRDEILKHLLVIRCAIAQTFFNKIQEIKEWILVQNTLTPTEWFKENFTFEILDTMFSNLITVENSELIKSNISHSYFIEKINLNTVISWIITNSKVMKTLKKIFFKLCISFF